jgi:sarcosine oxidase subunit gamma
MSDAATSAAVRLRWEPATTLLRLRVALPAAEQAQQRLGLAAALQARGGVEFTSLWLGPDQWLLLSAGADAAALRAQVGACLGELRHHVVDASAALQRVRVEGSAARALLAMGTGSDCGPRALRPGGCVRTRFARLALVVHCVAEQEFDLYVDRSYRAYLEEWLQRAAGDPLLAARG